MRTYRLGIGWHADPSKGVGCVNEIASQLGGAAWSDHPATCVDPAITPIGMLYNDSFASDEELNADEYARSLPWRMVGTNGGLAISVRRAEMASAWAKEEAAIAAKYESDESARCANYAKYAASYAKYAANYATSAAANYDKSAAANYAKYSADSAAYAASYAKYAANYATSAASAAFKAAHRQRIRNLLDEMLALTELVEPCFEVRLEASR